LEKRRSEQKTKKSPDSAVLIPRHHILPEMTRIFPDFRDMSGIKARTGKNPCHCSFTRVIFNAGNLTLMAERNHTAGR